MWYTESALGEAEKKTHQIVVDSSENWYAIHPEVFEHESDLGLRLETFSGGVLLERGSNFRNTVPEITVKVRLPYDFQW